MQSVLTGSLRKKFLNRVWPLVMMYVVVTAIGAFAYGLFNAHNSSADALSKYIKERGPRENAVFERVIQLNQNAVESRRRLADTLPESEVDRLFEVFFPLRADGSRRSGDELFDGAYIEGLGHVYGMASYLTADAAITPELKRDFVTGALAVRHESASVDRELDNLFFNRFEPAGFVIFAPYRADKLTIYRYDFPPSITQADMFGEEGANLLKTLYATAETTKCLEPSRGAWDETGRTIVVGCQTPTYAGSEEAVELFGTTSFINRLAERSVQERSFEGSESYTLGPDGSVIFHSRLSDTDTVKTEDIARIQRSSDFAGMLDLVAQRDDKSGVIATHRLKWMGGLIAYYKLDAADWTYIVDMNAASIWLKALPTALLVFASTLAMGLLIIWRVIKAINEIGVRPLTELSQSVKKSTDLSGASPELTQKLLDLSNRKDEIGQLTAQILENRKRIFDHLETIESQKAQLETALETEKQANELQNQFVSMVSHEFRTPMAIIDGHARRLAKRAAHLSPEDVEERTKTIREAIRRMTNLMERMLETSKFVAGKIAISPDQMDLKACIMDVVGNYRDLSPAHQFYVDLSKVPDQVWGDWRLMETVFENLISNAVKYSRSNPKVSISSARHGNRFEIAVTDYGVGIPAEEIERISERYFRASTAKDIQGTGIGLNLVRYLLDEHHGTMRFESQEGEWTCVTVSLPLGSHDNVIQDAAGYI